MRRTALLSCRAALAAMSVLVSSCVGEMEATGGEDEPISGGSPSVPSDNTQGTDTALPVPEVDPAIKAAMRRDLGLTDREVDARLAIEANASNLEPTLRTEAGDAYAGTWIDDVDLKVHVAITDP